MDAFTVICTVVTVFNLGFLFASRTSRSSLPISYLTRREVEEIANEAAEKAVTAITRVRIQRTVQEMMVLERKHAQKAQE